MKFGKQIQAAQIPGWSTYYLDYKFLKKIISSLAANRPASEAAALALGVRPIDSTRTQSAEANPIAHLDAILHTDSEEPPLSVGQETRSADFQAHKAAFFFKLERELEKINAFYLRKEAELKLRLETLLSKRRAAAMRGLPESVEENPHNHVEWSAVEEGFRLLERDLGKLQRFIELNATGFRKILKKWDKRSKSTTKELYLARQVDVQPIFNRQLISELADTVAICLLDLTDLSSGLAFEGAAVNDVILSKEATHRTITGAFYDLQKDLQLAILSNDEALIKELVKYAEVLARQDGMKSGGTTNVTRILWRVITEAPPELADLVLGSLESPFDFDFVDDINGRGCLHEAAMFGAPRLINLCLSKVKDPAKVDLYGRSPLHYAAMKGHVEVCRQLLAIGLQPDLLDLDDCNPIIYATMGGNADCVKALLEGSSLVEPTTTRSGDLNPLSLASRSGHVDVVVLLLQHGAHSLPNTNGEYPIHLAAQEGHVNICRLLLDQKGWDIPDKYQEWTPLFHAARHGRDACVALFISARSRVTAVDELGRSPIHYAAWHGHTACVELLLQATKTSPVPSPPSATHSPGVSIFTTTPNAAPDLEDSSDIDMIPSLYLPPPIMPHRIYGHNYLDKTSFLVQVSIGSSIDGEGHPGVLLHSRLNTSTLQDLYLPATTPLKMVMLAGTASNSAPYTISLPQQDSVDTFVFQIPSLSSLNLEFSIYPNFGTKTIGRAVALPSLFEDLSRNAFILPIMDHRLHVIGEVSFRINLVTPFDGVTLEVGGVVETYWKSNATVVPAHASDIVYRISNIPRITDSTQTSPSDISVPASHAQALTFSSVRGSYTNLVVQVTRDWHPVVYNGSKLPGMDLDIHVSDVTLVQLENIAKKQGLDFSIDDTSQPIDLEGMSNCIISLSKALKFFSANMGLSLELAYPTRLTASDRALPDLNLWVDSVLRSIYARSLAPAGSKIRRRITFMSSSPRICCALNWKQPNYPVFFAGLGYNVQAGSASNNYDGAVHIPKSFTAAVDFARMNNLLGLLVDADLLIKVPSLVDRIRAAGLLVCVAASPGTTIRDGDFDAVLRAGVVQYIDHSSQDLI